MGMLGGTAEIPSYKKRCFLVGFFSIQLVHMRKGAYWFGLQSQYYWTKMAALLERAQNI